MCEEESDETWRRALVFFLLLSFSVMTNWGVFTDWNYTQWLFDYDFGLIKRGLAGQLATSVGLVRSYANVRALCAVLALSLAATLWLLFTRIAAVDRKRTGGWLFALFWLTHPCTLPHYFFDMGRLDTLSLLICTLAVLGILHAKQRPALAIAVLASTSLILVHEANALLFVPLLFACWLHSSWSRLVVLDWVAAALGLGWLAWLELKIGSIAGVPGFTLDTFHKHLQAGSEHIDLFAVEPLFRSPGDNYTYSAGYLNHVEFVMNMLFFVLGLAPSFVLIYHMGKAAYADVKLRLPDLVLVGAVVSPLVVSAVAADYFRWLAISLTNVGLALVVVARNNGTADRLCQSTFRNKGLLFTCLALHCALGGVAHDSSFNILWRFETRVVATVSLTPGGVVDW